MNDNININTPAKFQEKLIEVMEGIYELFELSKEHNFEPVSEDGVTRYIEECGKTCFQVSGQFNRPSEYLESLLDIIRVNYEPCVLGTLFLNSNMGFLYDAIPEKPFRLGYISITSKPNKQFNLFWKEDVVPYIEECGYSIQDASSIFAVATTGGENYSIDLIDNISTTLNSGFSVDEAVELMAAFVCETLEEPTKQIYSGYCLDAALEDKIRLSLWLFINSHESTIQ
jgi:hypothetical protein